MIVTIIIGRKQNNEFIEEPLTQVISSNWSWILQYKAKKIFARVIYAASEIYGPYGKTLVYGEIKTDKDRPHFSSIDVTLDGKYAFSIEQDALI